MFANFERFPEWNGSKSQYNCIISEQWQSHVVKLELVGPWGYQHRLDQTSPVSPFLA